MLFLLSLPAGTAGEQESAAPLKADLSTAAFPVNIRGPAPFAAAVRESLSHLLDAAPDDYAFVTEQIKSIEIGPGGGLSCALVNVKTKTVLFPADWRYDRYDRGALSGILVREAAHVWLYENNYLFYGPEAEKYRVEEKVHTYILLN